MARTKALYLLNDGISLRTATHQPMLPTLVQTSYLRLTLRCILIQLPSPISGFGDLLYCLPMTRPLPDQPLLELLILAVGPLRLLPRCLLNLLKTLLVCISDFHVSFAAHCNQKVVFLGLGINLNSTCRDNMDNTGC